MAGEQAAQAAVPFANVPAGQDAAVYAHEGAPAGLNAPAGQLVQEERASAPDGAEKKHHGADKTVSS